MPKKSKQVKPAKTTTELFEEALAARPAAQYVLRLYVTGTTPKSIQAIQNIKAICEEYLHERYHLEIIDVYQQPEQIKAGDIVAVPTLIKRLPLPLRRLVGDLSKQDRILVGLDLQPKKPA